MARAFYASDIFVMAGVGSDLPVLLGRCLSNATSEDYPVSVALLIKHAWERDFRSVTIYGADKEVISTRRGDLTVDDGGYFTEVGASSVSTQEPEEQAVADVTLAQDEEGTIVAWAGDGRAMVPEEHMSAQLSSAGCRCRWLKRKPNEKGAMMATMTEATDGTQTERPLENWFLLMDPAWSPSSENGAPPIEAVVGLWPVEGEGRIGKFRANPEYVPTDENSPSDPLDAVLRLVLQGRAEAEHIQLMLRDTLFDVAMNGDGRPLVTKSPDDIACVVVATGETYRRRIASPDWRRIDLGELVELLTDGVDVLFNPGGPASVRLNAAFMRETLTMDDEEVAKLYASSNQDKSGLKVVPWEPTAEKEAPAKPGPDAPKPE